MRAVRTAASGDRGVKLSVAREHPTYHLTMPPLDLKKHCKMVGLCFMS